MLCIVVAQILGCYHRIQFLGEGPKKSAKCWVKWAPKEAQTPAWEKSIFLNCVQVSLKSKANKQKPNHIKTNKQKTFPKISLLKTDFEID